MALGAQPSLALRWQWRIADGLPQSTVTEFTVDGAGAVWAATYGGLIRFDGARIESFGLDRLPVLQSNRVSALTLSRDGTLWMGTPEGRVVRLRGEQVIDSLPMSPAAGRTVDVMVEALDRTLWARIGETVLSWRSGRWRVMHVARPHSHVNTPMLSLPDATILTVDRDTLLRLSPSGTVQRVLLDGLRESGDAVISALRRDASGRLWVGTSGALYMSDSAVPWNIAPSPVSGVIPTDAASSRVARPRPMMVRMRRVVVGRGHVTALHDGGDGSMLVTTRSALLRVTPTTWTVEQIALPNGAENLSAIQRTHDGAVIVGTFGHGMLVYSPSVAQRITKADGLFAAEVFSVTADGRGGAYLGSDCAPIVHLARADTSPAALNAQGARARDQRAAARPRFRVRDTVRLDGRREVCVSSLQVDARGALWVGAAPFVWKRSAEGVSTRWEVPRLAVGEDIRTMLTANDLTFVGTTDGRILVVGRNQQLRELPGWRAPNSEHITALALAPDGALWVGTAGGVVVRVSADALAAGDSALRRFSRAEGIPSGEIRVLHPEPSGHLWVGSYGDGLARIAPDGTVRRWTLPDVTVTALIPDTAQLYLLGNRGISVVRRQQLEQQEEAVVVPVRLLSEPDGVFEGNAGFPSAARIDARHLAFSSVDGVSVLDTEESMRNVRPATLVIRQLRSEVGPMAMADTITLQPDTRVISLSLSGPSFLNSDWLRYRYWVEGRDDDWIYLGEQRDLTLAALPPKTVTFRAGVQTEDGGWVDAAPLVLRVVPLWHESMPVRAFMAAAVLLTVLAAIRWQVNLLRDRAMALELQMDERRALAEATERHQRELAAVGRVALAGEMSAALAHELGQPLSAIMNDAAAVKRLLARGAAPAALEPVVQHLTAQTERARSVIRVLRSFLAPDSTEVDLSVALPTPHTSSAGTEHAPSAREKDRRGGARVQTLRVRTLLTAAEGLMRQEYRDAGITLETVVQEAALSVRGERVLIEQILVNLLANSADAVRSREVRRVGVRARRSGAGVRITVIDSGPGVADGHRNRVFDPFVTLKPQGMGMGLTIVRRLVEGHEGWIAVRRGPYGGAAFSVWLPAGAPRGDNT